MKPPDGIGDWTRGSTPRLRWAAECAVGGGSDRKEGQGIAGRAASEAEGRASPGDHSGQVVADLARPPLGTGSCQIVYAEEVLVPRFDA